jgi:hypothetical protein
VARTPEGALDTGFVQAADEFYIMAGRAFPRRTSTRAIADRKRVGMCRLLEREFDEAYRAEDRAARPARIAIACGVSVAPFLEKLIQDHRFRARRSR